MSRPRLRSLALFLLCLPCCGPLDADADADARSENAPWIDGADPQALTQGAACRLATVTVRNFGRVVFEGPLDLGGEVWRIARGEHLPYRHDGTVFRNRERRLPIRGGAYYHEYVHPTPGIAGPGPQRLVVGAAGDLNYTPDHYATFVSLDPECALESGMAAGEIKRMAPQTGLEPVTR